MKTIRNKTERMKLIENKHGVMLEEILRKLYVDENKSIMDIAKFLNTSHVTTLKWLDLAGIYSRQLQI